MKPLGYIHLSLRTNEVRRFKNQKWRLYLRIERAKNHCPPGFYVSPFYVDNPLAKDVFCELIRK